MLNICYHIDLKDNLLPSSPFCTSGDGFFVHFWSQTWQQNLSRWQCFFFWCLLSATWAYNYDQTRPISSVLGRIPLLNLNHTINYTFCPLVLLVCSQTALIKVEIACMHNRRNLQHSMTTEITSGPRKGKHILANRKTVMMYFCCSTRVQKCFVDWQGDKTGDVLWPCLNKYSTCVWIMV